MEIVLILIGKRLESAVRVQEVLTAHGDMIKTRLGLNRELSQDEDASGFVFLEVCAEQERIQSLCGQLNDIHEVKAECVSLQLPGCQC